METDLMKLLRNHAISHPTRFAAVEFSHGALKLTVVGNPWWRQDSRGSDEQIILRFEGIGDGLLDPRTLLDLEEDEQLDVFRISPLSQEGWAESGPFYDTYCHEPVADPLRIYAVVEDFLWQTRAPRTARDFLNIPTGSLSQFCTMAAGTSFLLAQSPKQIHDIVLEELHRQNVGHTVIRHDRPLSGRLFVEIGGSSFVCERATAEI